MTDTTKPPVAADDQPAPVADDQPILPAADQPAVLIEAEPQPGRADALRARLRTEAHRFSFYAVMRLLEALHPERPRFGQSLRPAQDVIRLQQEPSVVHAPAAMAGFETDDDGTPDRLKVYFFGLFGPDGPLPLHLTEFARDRRRNHGDRTFQAFADLFHHRLLSLFYRAWADSRPTVSFDRPDQDRFAHYVRALIGLATPGLHNRDAMPDLTKLHFAGLLAAQPRNAEGLGQILSAFFDVPVRVESLLGAWLSLPDSDYSRLSDSRANAELGKTTLLGKRVWSRQHKFRIVFGPLSLADYRRLLPGGLSLHRLIPIVRNYAGDALIWDVALILRAEEVPKIQLGRQGQIGWTTWLAPRRASADAADLFLDASADSHAVTVHWATHQHETTGAVS
jgi:type VI secretion system protein ImpH